MKELIDGLKTGILIGIIPLSLWFVALEIAVRKHQNDNYEVLTKVEINLVERGQWMQ